MEICVASRVPPNYHGGLAAYQRLLIKLLSKKAGWSGTIAFEIDTLLHLPTISERLDWSSYKLRQSLLGQLTRSQWSRLASRPKTHGLLEWVLRRAWRDGSS